MIENKLTEINAMKESNSPKKLILIGILRLLKI